MEKGEKIGLIVGIIVVLMVSSLLFFDRTTEKTYSGGCVEEYKKGVLISDRCLENARPPPVDPMARLEELKKQQNELKDGNTLTKEQKMKIIEDAEKEMASLPPEQQEDMKQRLIAKLS